MVAMSAVMSVVTMSVVTMSVMTMPAIAAGSVRSQPRAAAARWPRRLGRRRCVGLRPVVSRRCEHWCARRLGG
jgi:hypothetical protein